MRYLEKLQSICSIREFAPLLGFKPYALSFILYKIPNNQKYKNFCIDKKSGGQREIKAPVEKLKLVQRRLANVLNRCIQEIEENKPKERRPLSHGFQKKFKTSKSFHKNQVSLGIHTNAKCHRNKRHVFNLDIKDFFPSFNFGRVRGFFIKNNDFLLNPAIATLIAQIACHENELPQGSPCSPVITNLIGRILDVRLARLAKKHHCMFSRYADDITFSTNQKIFPEQIAKFLEPSLRWDVGIELENIITRSGFQINRSKTHMQYNYSRQTVTGLVVNKKVNIRSDYYRYARSMCHSLFTTGDFSLPNKKSKSGTVEQLEGILSHIYFIKEYGLTGTEKISCETIIEWAKKNQKRPKFASYAVLYSKFLFYRYFTAPEYPTIVCEGKTDAIYLKCANRQIDKSTKGNFIKKIHFFKHNNRAKSVMHINEGTPALKNFIVHFKENTKFSNQPRKYPVIVLLDNDKEAGKVVDMLREKFTHENIEYERSATFVYPVVHNLFVVLLPKSKSLENRIIEDLFHPTVFRVLEGKTFSAENKDKFNNQKHYSKKIFATRIVRPDQNKIDFSEFRLLFEQFSKVINDYRST